jgi:hypothetical protein
MIGMEMDSGVAARLEAVFPEGDFSSDVWWPHSGRRGWM